MTRRKRRRRPTIKQKAEKLLEMLKLREQEFGSKIRYVGRGVSGKDL